MNIAKKYINLVQFCETAAQIKGSKSTMAKISDIFFHRENCGNR